MILVGFLIGVSNRMPQEFRWILIDDAIQVWSIGLDGERSLNKG